MQPNVPHRDHRLQKEPQVTATWVGRDGGVTPVERAKAPVSIQLGHMVEARCPPTRLNNGRTALVVLILFEFVCINLRAFCCFF